MVGNGASGAELLVFDLDGRLYGLSSDVVVEVVRAVAVSPLPNGPRVVTGVMNLRGRLVPVFDLRVRFGLAPLPIEPSEHFIVADAGHRRVALRVDRVMKLAVVPQADLEPTEAVVSGTEHVSGIAKLPEGIVLIHDLGAFLSEAERATLDRAMSAVAEAP